MENKLAKNFNFFSLIKFALPTMIMMIFSSLYIMVDGVFVSRFISTDALSAVNIVYPLYNVILAIAIMLAAGGSALVAKEMGQQMLQKAKSHFSLIIIAGFLFGVIFALPCLIFIKPIIYLLGSNDNIYHYCYDYIFPILIASPLCILQIVFHSFFIAAGKPRMTLFTSLLGGTTNIIFDYIFIVIMQMGIIGAAYGTILGFIVQIVIDFAYFIFNRKGTLYLILPKIEILPVIRSCYYGMAEMFANFGLSITTFFFNITMMKYIGVNGVAAITIMLYTEYILTSIFYGYASGVAPVFSYNYGAKNSAQLKNVFEISILFILLSSMFIYVFSLFTADDIISIFTIKDSDVFNITMKGFFIYATSFLFIGFNLFATSLFTALSNGKISSIIATFRTFIFLSLAILILPILFNIVGIWLCVPVAEFLAFIISWYYFIRQKNKYGYL